MTGEQLEKIVDQMTPQEAAAEMGRLARKLFRLVDESVRIRFVMNLVEEPDADDKVSSLVHL